MISVDFISSNNETVALDDDDDLHSAGSGNWQTRKSTQ